jgi:hypothetical protein
VLFLKWVTCSLAAIAVVHPFCFLPEKSKR